METSLRKIILKQQGNLCRSKNRVLAEYLINTLDTLVEALKDARILCRYETYFEVREQLLVKLWDIRNYKKIGQI